MIDTPILQLRRELLMRNFKKVSQLFGVIEPEQVSDRQNYEHFEGDRIVFSKLVMKDRKKPDKFLLPHRVPSDDREFAFSSRVFPKVAQIKAPYKLWHYQITLATSAWMIKPSKSSGSKVRCQPKGSCLCVPLSAKRTALTPATRLCNCTRQAGVSAVSVAFCGSPGRPSLAGSAAWKRSTWLGWKTRAVHPKHPRGRPGCRS